ncbi:MAG: glycosyltransferase family 4 protein, partial [Candidatus Saccharibacteria bacterium]|nr:glycosyltransferase family 4 protein [Candidatus Saccharibacteria bacterium]
MVENEKNIPKKGRIAWFAPDLIEGSGGHRTIFQNANELIKRGYACDLIIKPIWRPMLPNEIYNNIKEWYGDFDGDVFNDYNLVRDYDMVIATGWETASPAADTNIKRKLYFMQDYEPWFFAMGVPYLLAKKTYEYDLFPVAIGHYLPEKMKQDYKKDAGQFDFCADLTQYYKKKDVKKENAICFVYQPSKPRRCAEMGMKALQIVQKLRPDVKIYLFGSPKMVPYNIEAEHLGILPIEKCNDLYNSCKVGLCLSTTNPSRVPFEMMAAGLPVVELGLENNLYDFPEDGCLLVELSPEAIANAILKILDDEKLAKRLSDGGVKYMKKYPLDKGYEQFGKIIDTIFEGRKC